MRLFYQELKRRNVLRVAVLYVLLAWVILQVADVIFGLINVPDWAGKLVLVLLLLGLPLVLIFAWAFEITPDGLKRESEIDRSQSITHVTGRKLNTMTGILAGVAILLIVAQAFVPGLRPRASSAASGDGGVRAASIAVLPFVNMSSDREQEYFSDGLSEELLNLLAKIPELTVISRTSSFQFKGKNEDVRKIADLLGVAHVLEGSVRKSADKVRITAQLIKAADGSHVWSNTYDKTLDDIFAVQDEIAAEVVKALRVSILGNVPHAGAQPENPAAYNFFLQARHFGEQRNSEGDRRAIAYLDSALRIDPNYARAWAYKSRVLRMQIGRGDLPIEAGVQQSRAAAERALALDPGLVDAHVALASVEMLFSWDWPAAERHTREAEALDREDYGVLITKSNLAATMGRFAEAVAALRRITQRNPLQAGAYANLALALVRLDSLPAAGSAFRKALDLNPEAAGTHSFLALTLLLQDSVQQAQAENQRERSELWRAIVWPLLYHAQGRRAESDRALRDLEQRFGSEAAYQIANAYAYRGEVDQAFKWLDRAYELRDAGITEILGDPLMKNIVTDPRYKAMLRKLKLPES